MTALDHPVKPRSRRMHASSSSPAPLAAPLALLALLGAGLLLVLATVTGPRAAVPELPFAAHPANAPAALPALYVPNAGQAPPGVLFEARSPGGGLRFGAGEVVAGGVRIRFAGASPQARVLGTGRR